MYFLPIHNVKIIHESSVLKTVKLQFATRCVHIENIGFHKEMNKIITKIPQLSSNTIYILISAHAPISIDENHVHKRTLLRWHIGILY